MFAENEGREKGFFAAKKGAEIPHRKMGTRKMVPGKTLMDFADGFLREARLELVEEARC